MLKLTRGQTVDHLGYLSTLQSVGYINFNTGKAREMLKYHKIQSFSREYSCTRLMEADTNGRYFILNDNSIHESLIDYYGCPEHYFNSADNKKGWSISIDKVLEPLLSNGYASHFLEEYIGFVRTKSSISVISGMIGRASYIDGDFNNKGEQLARLYFEAKQEKNARIYYSKEAIISIPRMYKSCIEALKDYILVWGDFDQSDFRIFYNLFIRDEENIKIMKKYKDKYKGMCAILADFYGEEFDEEDFAQDRELYKQCILATTYGRANDLNKKKKEFIKKFHKYLDTCPRYVKFKQSIRNRCRVSDTFTVEAYFGYTESIPVIKVKGDDTFKNTTNDALNSPIQSTTSELVILSTMNILQQFYDLGYTEDDIRPLFVRHDEPIFIMKKSVLKDSWVFRDNEDIIVDDWAPLSLKFSMGETYTEVDEEIMAQYEESCRLNQDKIRVVESGESKDYSPIQDILAIGIGTAQVGNDSVCIVVDLAENKVDKLLFENTRVQDARQMIIKNLLDSSKYVYDNNYSSAIIYVEDYMEPVHTDYASFYFENSGYVLSMAKYHVAYFAKKYAKKKGIEFRTPCAHGEDFVELTDKLGMIDYEL